MVIREGTNGQPEVVILGFIPSDQRRFSYNFVFGLELTIMKIAEAHGGRPYATGLYFSKKADQILGKERADKLRAFIDALADEVMRRPGFAPVMMREMAEQGRHLDAPTVALLLVVATILFFSIHLLPGDPVLLILGGDAAQPTPEQIATVRAKLGLDKLLWLQYLTWLQRVTRGDLGRSLVDASIW